MKVYLICLFLILSFYSAAQAETEASSPRSQSINLRSTLEQSSSGPSVDEDGENLELQDRAVKVLRSEGWVSVRSEPNKMASFSCPSGVSRAGCRNARSVNYSTELILTGNRECDRDSNVCYIEASFENNGNSFTGWFDEKQTSLDPEHALLRQSSLTDPSLRINQDYSEVGISENGGYTLDMSPSSVEFRENMIQDLIDQQVEDARRATLRAEAADRMFPTSRGLLRLNNPDTRRGLCGSYDYSDDGGDESYASPTAACAIAQLSERWRREQCPTNGACRLQIGDISHATRKEFDGHRTHTHGHCVDFQTIRKERYTQRVDYEDDLYDQEKTEQLLRLMRELGGTEIIFNDQDLIDKGLSRRVRNHDSHIHVCFKPDNETVLQQCRDYQPDPQICPTSEILFGHPLMVNMQESLEANN